MTIPQSAPSAGQDDDAGPAWPRIAEAIERQEPPTAARPRPGQLRRGYHMIARDLDRAFSLAMLGTYEAFVLQVVREQSWAAAIRRHRKGEPIPEPIPFRLNCCELARQTGLNRSLIARGFRSLVASRILSRRPDGSVLINKDYPSWIFPAGKAEGERPRFGPVQLAYIAGRTRIEDARAVADEGPRIGTQEYQSSGTSEYQTTGTSEYQTGTPEYQPAEGAGTPGYQRLVPVGLNVGTPEYQSHIEEHARGELIEGRKKDIIPLPPSENQPQSGPVSPAAPPSTAARPDPKIIPAVAPTVPGQRFDAADCPAYPRNDDLYEILSAKYPMDPDRAEDVFRMLWQAFGSRRICYDFYVRQQRFPFDFWVAAIRKAIRNDAAVRSLNYVETIAGEFARKGKVPGEAPMDSPDLKAPPKPRQYHTARAKPRFRVPDHCRPPGYHTGEAS